MYIRTTTSLKPGMRQLPAIVLTTFLLSCSGSSNELESKVQSLELHYISWACDCANWATLPDIAKYPDNVGDTLANRSIFIEPANAALVLPDTIGYNGDIVRFTGQFYKYKGFPQHYRSGESPDKADRKSVV
jgi:hypothetical protein